MLQPFYTKQFSKDIKKMVKRGKDPQNIKHVIGKLINQEMLDPKYRDHKLVGSYKDRRECHVEPDWLLVYKTLSEEIIFERTGTHSDLFE